MNIPRYYQNLDEHVQPGRALLIFGPRQVGKTTLLKQHLAASPLRYKLETGDNIRARDILGSEDLPMLRQYVANCDILAVDEAQRIPGIGRCLKLLIDEVPGLRIIATGSSSFELAGQVGEPLTGRKRTIQLYPLADMELRALMTPYELREQLMERLVFGGYPQAVTAQTHAEKQAVLHELVESYLLKDVLELDRMKGSRTLLDLLRLLAYQIGKEVSLSELAGNLHIDAKTVARYLDLLEKSFVIVNVRGFSRNLRSEVTRSSRYYFLDTGIRNAVIANFNEAPLRNDLGMLWENHIVVERMKFRAYSGIAANTWFWRTWEQQEIDLVEERDGMLHAYECKWGGKMPRVPKAWSTAYPQASYEVISPETYQPFVGIQ